MSFYRHLSVRQNILLFSWPWGNHQYYSLVSATQLVQRRCRPTFSVAPGCRGFGLLSLFYLWFGQFSTFVGSTSALLSSPELVSHVPETASSLAQTMPSREAAEIYLYLLLFRTDIQAYYLGHRNHYNFSSVLQYSETLGKNKLTVNCS